MQTWTVTEYGFKIYVDGELVATFTKDQYMRIIADLSRQAVSHPFPLTESPTA